MKKLLVLLALVSASFAAVAQNDKFTKAMEPLVAAVDTTRSVEWLTELANSFERIANAEKTQWLPYYYAALCNVNIANMYFQLEQLAKIDIVADKAEPLMNKAMELEKNNSELMLLKKMFNTARMMADPMNRYMTYGPAASEALATAKSLDPNNPRVYLMEGIDKFYTPAEYGGSKEEGKKLFEEADKKFQVAKPASSIHPNWGRQMVAYFLAEASK